MIIIIIYDTFLLQPNSRHLISHFVTAFETPVSTSHLRDTWSKELEVPLSEELWEEGLSSIQKCSINSRYHLIQFKVIHRLHYSKTKLYRIFESVSPTCDRRFTLSFILVLHSAGQLLERHIQLVL